MKITPLRSGLLSGSVAFSVVCTWGVLHMLQAAPHRFHAEGIFFVLVPNALTIAFPFFTGGFFARYAYETENSYSWERSMEINPLHWGLLSGTIASTTVYVWGVLSFLSSCSTHNLAGVIFVFLPFMAFIVAVPFFIVGVIVGAIKESRQHWHDHDEYYDD